MFFSKVLIGIGILLAQCFLESSCAVTARIKEQRELGLVYGCAFHGLPPNLIDKTEVDWFVNGVNVIDFKNHFDIRYTNDWTGKILYSYLHILNPIALRGPSEIKCSVESSYITFQMNNVVAGNPVNFRFPKGEVRKDWIDKCNEWQGTLVGCENNTCECALKALEIIDITSELPIRKNPFIAFKIVDKTLPTHMTESYKNYNSYVAYVNTNDDENPNEIWGSKRQTENSFFLKSKGSSIKPGVPHDVVIRHYGAMWNRDEYSPEEDHFIEEHFKLNTSSLVPNKPKILKTSFYVGHYPNINFHFESNVAEEESSFFVPKLYKNGVIDRRAILTKSGNVFMTENFKVNDTFGIKIHSTEEKYNSQFSNIIHIDEIYSDEGFIEILRGIEYSTRNNW